MLSSNMLLLILIPLIGVTFSTPTPDVDSYFRLARHSGTIARTEGGRGTGRLAEDNRTPGAHFGYRARGEVMDSRAKRLRFSSRLHRAPTPVQARSRGPV